MPTETDLIKKRYLVNPSEEIAEISDQITLDLYKATVAASEGFKLQRRRVGPWEDVEP